MGWAVSLLLGWHVLVVRASQPRTESEAQSWAKVCYLGGMLGVRGRSLSWKNTLSISPHLIELQLHNGPRIRLQPALVTAITYHGKRMPRTVSPLAFALSPPAALVVGATKETVHYIGIEYRLPDGRAGGMLLRAHKDNFDEIVAALRKATGIMEQSKPSP